ncbi:hypothetical protein [Clostridium folliculivorans]|uniref:Uncharacterized protein n=1 Tax=Clostridium folliculivorans TaxID=2886038 RepID=A0A9W6DAW3_9CLOT|nr:hypothetical protein [Clostridium folliculivorans]GKU25247.1 hypothetical protein CFOLD11_20730 [Clostridium folliculivorans]GKU28268.1 hypothetical protein CFB3_03740 [Clostridium folliculivorans]
MEEDNKNKNITDEEEYFSVSSFLKKKENQYVLKVLGLSLVLYILAGNFLTTEGSSESGISSISYFLALIASVLVVNGYDKVKNSNKR